MSAKPQPMPSTVCSADGKLDALLLVQAMVDASLLDPLIMRRVRSERATSAHSGALALIERMGVEMRDGQAFDAEAVVAWLCEAFALSKVPSHGQIESAAELASMLAEPFAKRYDLVPLSCDAQKLVIGTTEPFDQSWHSIVRKTSGRRIELQCLSPSRLAQMQKRVYKLADSMDKADHRVRNHERSNQERLVSVGHLDDNDERNLSKLVDWMLNDAIEQGASDIHLQATRDQSLLRFRIDGQLLPIQSFPSALHVGLISRLKHMAGLDVVEHRRPQDGRLKVQTVSGVEHDVRLSLMPTAFGEKAVLRVLDSRNVQRGLAQLGMGPSDLERWGELLAKRSGLVLVTGPTGSGKTSTLYATLQDIHDSTVNISTIEDPIEYVIPEFAQLQVNSAIGLDFASGIRTLLRQDPDVLMVGEIRDAETAQMAIQAALTGHLVVATLHTNDAPGAVARLRDLGVPPYLIEATLLGVLAQRLLRRLCPNCKTSAALDSADWQKSLKPLKWPAPKSLYGAQGCDACAQTGYKGRLAVFEIFALTQLSQSRLLHESTHRELRLAALRGGMRGLRQDAMQKVAKGETSLQEALAVTPNLLGF